MYKNAVKSRRKINFLIISCIFLYLSAGCNNKFFDPSQVGRFRPVPAVNVILDSLGVAEETPVAWEGGEEPRYSDIEPTQQDHVFMSGDVIKISIHELRGIDTTYVQDCIVTETGTISIAELEDIQASGMTERQLEDRLKQMLSPGLLKNPLVTVTLLSSQQRTYSIIGDGVRQPNRYTIPRYDYRLTDAIASAGGISQFNVSYIYVTRIENNNQTGGQNFNNVELQSTNRYNGILGIPLFEAQEKLTMPQSSVVISSSEMLTERESTEFSNNFNLFETSTQSRQWGSNPLQAQAGLRAQTKIDEPVSVDEVLRNLSQRSVYQNNVNTQGNYNNRFESPDAMTAIRSSNGNERVINEQINNYRSQVQTSRTANSEINGTESSEQYEWIFDEERGQWMPRLVEPSEPEEPIIQIEPETGERIQTVPEITTTPGIELRERETTTRLIKIPKDELFAGIARYNIVIKPADTIFVPADVVGEFYIMGNVNNPGPKPLTGRAMTLKQAIVVAGGLNPIAWPKKCEVTRRIGRNKEETVMVDLDKIFSGEQPDFYIKPDDTINVGTHETSRWRAILRNAFRATYGFGFVYDRNFADRDFYTSRPFPNWF